MRNRLLDFPFVLILIVLATWVYAPALFRGQTQIHGDSVLHSLSVIELNRKMIHEGISPLWTNLLYGGHPYFAEVQGGFLYPLNFVVALFFDPIAGLNIYHWLSIMIGALGMYWLCKHFQYSRESSTFGALAVVFSAYWLKYHDNVTVSGALCCLPWVFLCFERWMESPAIKTALWFAVSVSLLIFAGYPQIFHGAVIYMAVSLIPTLFSGYIGGWNNHNRSWKQYLLTGLVAMIVCTGLSAAQWLPLLELATWSHRSGGVDILYPGPLSMYLSGFLFVFYGANVKTLSFGLVGSVMVCFIASLSLIVKPRHRMIGHILASFTLIILGLEYATPIFKYLLKYSLPPGLKYFRIVHPYIGLSIVGLGLLSGFAIDRIQRQANSRENQLKSRLIFLASMTVLFLTWMGLVLWLKTAEIAKMTYVSFFAVYLILLSFTISSKSRWFGYAALMLMVLDIAALRISPAPFVSPHILEKPRLVREIQSDIKHKEYKLMDISAAGGVGFVNPWSPDLEKATRNAFTRAFPSTSVLWNIPSMDANLALPLARRRLIQSKLESEISGKDATPPGFRLIDYLGIRFISADAILQGAGLKALITDDIIVMENQYALPKIQSFTKYEMVNSSDEALNRLKQIKEPTLILESPIDKKESAKDYPASASFNVSNALEASPVKMTNVEYKFDVHAGQPAWLFIADANYPGWQASIDGKPTAVYNAQILGKAVFVPQGEHRVTVAYKPLSFRIGFALTAATILALCIMGVWILYRRHHLPVKCQAGS